MEKLPLAGWINKELSKLLECDVGEEYCKNILSMKNAELVSFVESLLDMKIPGNKKFFNELMERLSAPAVDKDITVYRKPKLQESLPKSKQPKAKNNIEEDEQPDYLKDDKQQKSKKQFVNLYSSEGQASIQSKLTGRHSCECQALKHKLIANCLTCGRIVCEQEGTGPCFFCGNIVCTKEEMAKINSGSRKGEKLKNDLLSKSWQGFDAIVNKLNKMAITTHDSADLQKAIEHKNKLIEYDRNCTKRTQVIDDESDYFQSNSKWLNKNQRDILMKKQLELDEKRYGSRLGQSHNFTLDISNKAIIEDREHVDYEKLSNDIETILSENNSQTVETALQALISNRSFPAMSDVANPDIGIDAPKFIDDNKQPAKKEPVKASTVEPLQTTRNLRIQDKELQEMKDDGMCLSMHQPWASLLVYGIKKHEGRTWYTPYRGRLWIHAGSKQPTEEDIKQVEMFYSEFYQDQHLEFPSSYPTSCLLGYVDLIDCLPEDTYKEQFPSGESGSPYVFICANPFELLVKFPMAGQHKIFKTERSIHFGARKTAVVGRNN